MSSIKNKAHLRFKDREKAASVLAEMLKDVLKGNVVSCGKKVLHW
jgi:hypothetical protein